MVNLFLTDSSSIVPINIQFAMKYSPLLTILTLTLTPICSLWGDNPILRVLIQQNEKGKFIATFTKTGGDKACRAKFPGNSKRIIPGAFVQDIMASLSSIVIPAFPIPRRGNDGGLTTLELNGFLQSASFRWWTIPPPGWEPLDQIANKIWSLFLKDFN